MTMRLAPMVLLSLVLAACPKSDTGPGTGPGSGPTTPPPTTPADAAPALPDAAAPVTPAAQHETCSDTQPCAADLTCVKFHGIAGNEMASCEIQCSRKSEKNACPAGQKCMMIVDGPGEVCQTDTGGGGGGGGGGGALPKQTEACPANQCEKGLTCVAYYGVAGTRGPKFTSCEITCKGGKGCPKGQNCTTIADGPGQVCRP